MRKKILVVEDEDQMRKLLVLRLETSGYEAVTASSGEEALSEVMKKIPDLIILDLMLPGMAGYELCWRLKTDKYFCDIPVLIFSAKAEELDRSIGFQCGADDYISKSFDGEVLVERIGKLLRNHPDVSYN